MKTYLITGGAGFIGANFIEYMLEKYKDIQIINLDVLTYAGNLENLKAAENNPRYVFIQGDIGDKEIITNIFTKYDVNYIVNFAAESHVDRSISEPDIFVKTNVVGTIALLNCAMEAWKTGDDTYKDNTKFLQVSTDEVYGSLGQTGYFTELSPIDPHSPYSASKASADFFVKAYYDTYKLPINITRCSNNYGPYQFPEKLIPLIINNALAHQDLPIYGDGKQVRDWLFVEDHCKAIDIVINDGTIGETYNIGGHNERQNIKIVETILGFLQRNIDDTISNSLLKYVEDRKGHDRRYAIDPTKIHNDLGWYPETCFEEGIIKTVKWYLANEKWMANIVSGEYKEYYDKMYSEKIEKIKRLEKKHDIDYR